MFIWTRTSTGVSVWPAAIKEEMVICTPEANHLKDTRFPKDGSSLLSSKQKVVSGCMEMSEGLMSDRTIKVPIILEGLYYPIIFLYRMQPRATALDIWDSWHVAFHGTRATNVGNILDTGDLLMPGKEKSSAEDRCRKTVSDMWISI